ncbi:MAG: HAD family hydrolase, partial [Fimbriimonas ginsengisoli]|nr:HAD family hydrolase [Fimbriimonas ginsengisoli]
MSAERFATVLALFFDLDDTLCAYWEASKHGLRVAFERLGPPGKTPDEMIEHWARSFRSFSPSLKASDWYPAYLKTGEPTRTEQMRLALLEVGVDDPRRAGELSRCYMEERDRALRLFPDVTMVLDRLQERFRLGLITNGPADVQRQEIATLGLDGRFDPVLIEGELGFGKPHASVFEQAARLVA